jgi:hypothetical protein
LVAIRSKKFEKFNELKGRPVPCKPVRWQVI